MPAHHAGKKRPGGEQGCPHSPRAGYGSVLIVVLLFLLPPALLLLLVLALLHAHPGVALVGTAGGLLDRMFRLAALFALVLQLRLRLAPVCALVLLLLLLLLVLRSLLFLFHVCSRKE